MIGSPGRLRLVLAVVSMGAGVLMVYFGIVSRIEYDGWWHVFIARVSDWPAFWGEVNSNAHPPLFFLLLKLASYCLGCSRLAYRAVSILSGVFSVYLVGMIAARVFRSRTTVVLATLTFATSTVTVIMANEVRSYMLAGMFFLISILFFLDQLEPSSKQLRSRVFLSVGLTLGVLSHYSILFVLPIFVVMPLVLAVLFPAVGQRRFGSWKRIVPGHLIMLSVPVAVGAAEYYFHIRKFHGTTAFSYLKRFFFEPGEHLWKYVLRVSVDELDLFVPVDLLRFPSILQLLAVALVITGLVALVSVLRKEGDVVAAVVPVTFVLLTCGLLAASVIRRYPFGGTLRHQYVIFPLAVISVFLLVDRWVDRCSSRSRRGVVQGFLFSFVVVSAVSQWVHLEIRRVELATVGYQRFQSEFSDSSSIYVDQFSIILFFAHEHEAEWIFDPSFQRGRTDKMWVKAGDREFVVYRDRKWQAHLDDPAVFRNLRGTMRQERLDRMVVFHLERVPRGESLSQPRLQEGSKKRLKKFARQRGLAVAKVVRVRRGVFAEFELAELPMIRDDAVIKGNWAPPVNPSGARCSGLQTCNQCPRSSIRWWILGPMEGGIEGRQS